MKIEDYPELQEHWFAYQDAEEKMMDWFYKHCKNFSKSPKCKWLCWEPTCPYSLDGIRSGKSLFEYKEYNYGYN